VGVGSNDAFVLGVLSSQLHVNWSLATGGTLEDRPIYTKSKCFDPFPFPAAADLQKPRVRIIAEDLDAHRKRVLAEHPHFTLTGIYNVLEKLRAGTAPNALDTGDRRTFDDGLVLILQEHHDKLDTAVAAAYGWPADLTDNDILARLVALNQQRLKEEAAGQIRWLRPEYQIPRFGTAPEKLDLTGGGDAPATSRTRRPAQAGLPGQRTGTDRRGDFAADGRHRSAQPVRAGRALPQGSPCAAADRGRASRWSASAAWLTAPMAAEPSCLAGRRDGRTLVQDFINAPCIEKARKPAQQCFEISRCNALCLRI
jgi:hypothetical protein